MKFFCAVLLTVILSAGFCLRVQADLADGVKAIVNDKIITYQEVRDISAAAIDVLQREYADQPQLFDQKLNDTMNDGLETLIENQLILHEFNTKYNPLPDRAVDELVQDRIHEQFGDRITCVKTLQAEGKTYEQFRQEIRDQFIISQLRYKNLSDEKIVISPYKIQSYYQTHQEEFKIGDQVKLRMIVLNKESSDDTATRQKANDILDQIKKGSSFESLATAYSQDSQHQGSDWIETSVLRKELADAVASLQPGETSGIIETPDNCYILRLDDRRTTHVKSLADVRPDIEKTLRTQAQKDAQQKWIASLKKKAFIRYF